MGLPTHHNDKLVNTEYQPFDRGQPPVHFGERTSIQSVITSPWVLRWASIPATYATYRQIRKLGTIAMARELKVAPVLASEWTIDADDDAPDEWKTLVEKTFFPLRDEFMAATLYYGDVDFGYQCFEKVIEPKDGYLKITRFKPLLHDITEICIGHHGGFIGVRQLGKDLGLNNSIHVGFRVEGSYLYGIPLLENARQAYNWWIDCNEGARRYDRKIAGAAHRGGVPGRHVHRSLRQRGGKRRPGPHGPGQPGSGRRRGGPPRHGRIHAAAQPRIARLENLDP